MHPFGKAAPKDFVPMRPFFPIRNSGRIMCPTGKKKIIGIKKLRIIFDS